ncbi:hypothetical protein ACWDV4_22035 [Micromonospora sp. NPDC003197]
MLVFPIVWALLGRSRRFGLTVGAVLTGGVAGWSFGTVEFGAYATSPTVDDWLAGRCRTLGGRR